jgi:signal transduction histidine kinase/putative methionine-R-sulfoxide reductase with GAF domain
MNPIFSLIVGLLVGIALSGLTWFIWKRFRAPLDKVVPEGDQISAEESLQLGDESLQRRLDELTILHAIATAGAEATDEDILIERATQIIGESFFPNNFGVLLVDGDRLRTHPSYRELDKLKGPEWIPIGGGISGQVALHGEPRRVADVRHEQNYIEVDSATRSELCVPLKIGERVIGVLNAERELVDGFTDSDEILLSTIAGQLATAIDRLRAESAVHRRAGQLSILSSISQEVVASLIPEQVYAAIHRAAAQLMHVDVFLIVLQDEDQEDLIPVYFMDRNGPVKTDLIPVYQELSAHITATGESLLINSHEDLANLSLEDSADTESSILAVPLRLGGRVFGMLSCQSYRLREYTREDLDALNTLANQASIAIENARLFEETQTRLAELTFLSQIIAITATENDLTVALSLICTELAQFLQVSEVSFALLNSQLTMAQVIAEYHDSDRPEILGKQIPIIGNPVMTTVLESSSPLVIEDTQNDPLLAGMLKANAERNAASLLLVPIIFGREVVGTLEIVSLIHRQFSSAEISLAQKVTSQVGQVLERLGLFAATRDQAERMAHLATISEGLNRPLTPDEVIEGIGKGAMVLGQADRAALYLRQDNKIITAPWYEELSADFIQKVTARFEEFLGGILFRSSEPILISDIDQLPAKSLLKELGKGEGFRGVDLWPLVYKDDVVAAIGCYYNESHVGSDAEQEVMLTFARQAAVALVNARLFDETRRRTAQLEALNAIITEVTAASDLEHLLEITLEHTLRALGLQIGGIWVGEQRILHDMPTSLGEIFEQLNSETKYREPPTIAIRDWEMLSDGDQYFPYQTLLKKYDLRASLTVPLVSEGRPIGGLSIVSQQPREWLTEEIALVEGVGRQLGGAVERIALLERIQENAQQVQHIIDTVPEGVILLDEKRRVVLANPVAQTYLINLAGFTSGEILTHLGQKPMENLLRPEFQNLWYELEVSGPPRQVFEIGAQPLEKGDNPGGWVVVIREVTEERETQTRIQMQERLATVGQLAAGIAHDFNNILAAIVVYADLLRRDPNLMAGSQERLTIIQQQVQRAASLIRQILDFSRRSVMEQSLLDLLPFVKELDKLLRRVLPETIQIELTYQPGVYLVNADPSRLQQVFMNLAVNARDASSNGGTLKFELDQLQLEEGDSPPCPDIPPGSWNRITVKDTGEGIPPEVLPHIFEPFYTTKPVGEGTGLGLAQAYGIVKQHGGCIDAHSVVGAGTTFHIYLPAQLPIQEDGDISNLSLETRGLGETLLLVEDDYSTREAMKTLLEDSNYRVLAAANGQEALEIYEQAADGVAMVISDLVMPVMGGVTLYQTLRERWPEVKMLFITGHPVNEKDQAMLESGNVNWLQKPFSVGVFNEAVYNFLHE